MRKANLRRKINRALERRRRKKERKAHQKKITESLRLAKEKRGELGYS